MKMEEGMIVTRNAALAMLSAFALASASFIESCVSFCLVMLRALPAETENQET